MADTLEIFGVEYTNVAGIIAKDDNGVDQTYTKGDTDFNVTLTQDLTEKWIPDCTYAEVVAAYNNGKTITFTAGYPAFRAGFDSYDEFEGTITYYVDEVFSDLTDTGLNIKYYRWHGNSNIDLDSSEVYHITSNANAQPSDVVKDKVFYNADGYQVGTATGGTPTLQSKTYNVSSAGTATVTADSGYDGLSSVQVSVPSADVGPSFVDNFITQNNERKWTVRHGADLIDSGWFDTSVENTVTFNAVPSNTTIAPTESSQTIGGAYYMMEGAVTVNAIPSTYVGSGITQRSSSDLTASGATVTVPSGYYSAAASKSVASMTLPTSAASSATSGYTSKATIGRSTAAQYINIPPGYNSTGAYYVISAVANGSATAPASISGTAASVSTGTNTLTLTKTVSVTPTVSAGYVSAGTAGNSSVSLTASVTTKAAATITPTTTNQTIAAGTYLTGTQTIAGDADLVGSNILSTANIFGVQGTVDFIDVYIRSAAPTSSVGSDGDIYIQE